MKQQRILLLLAITVLIPAGTLRALDMCWIFDSGMVIQAEKPVPVWGQGVPGEEVTVMFSGQRKHGIVGADGEWKVLLDPMPPNAQSQPMTVKAPSGEKEFKDILVGDVWVCSGQSNMAQPTVQKSLGGAEEAAKPANPLLRAYSVAYNSWAAEPQTKNFPWDKKITNWFEWKSPGGGTSSVPYYFGTYLQPNIGRPVGLIIVPIGASNAEAWIPRADLAKDPEFAAFAQKSLELAAANKANGEAFRQKVADWKQRKAAAEAAGQPFKEKEPQSGMDPAFWPRWWAGAQYNSHIAPLRNMAITGVIWYQGENNAAGHGGCAKTSEGYQKIMKLLIASWRRQFENPELPFYIVQLSMFNWNDYNHKKPRDPNIAGGWSIIREAQEKVAQSVPKSGLVVTWYIGEKDNIHPANKRPVGERLAKLALRDTYKKDVVADGPTYDSYKIVNGKVRVRFKNQHGGLQVKGDKLSGFAIAGADQKFVWADARVDGDEVVVWSDQVVDPVAVRFGYIQFQDANLFNADGFPAKPFRTDHWQLASE